MKFSICLPPLVRMEVSLCWWPGTVLSVLGMRGVHECPEPPDRVDRNPQDILWVEREQLCAGHF